MSTSVAIACFLAQEGADLFAKNKHGRTPTQLCSDDVTTLLISFAERKGQVSMHVMYCTCNLHSSTGPPYRSFHGFLRRRDIQTLQPQFSLPVGMVWFI